MRSTGLVSAARSSSRRRSSVSSLAASVRHSPFSGSMIPFRQITQRIRDLTGLGLGERLPAVRGCGRRCPGNSRTVRISNSIRSCRVGSRQQTRDIVIDQPSGDAIIQRGRHEGIEGQPHVNVRQAVEVQHQRATAQVAIAVVVTLIRPDPDPSPGRDRDRASGRGRRPMISAGFQSGMTPKTVLPPFTNGCGRMPRATSSAAAWPSRRACSRGSWAGRSRINGRACNSHSLSPSPSSRVTANSRSNRATTGAQQHVVEQDKHRLQFGGRVDFDHAACCQVRTCLPPVTAVVSVPSTQLMMR